MNIKYEKYLSMEDVPAGKILDVILKKRNISQKKLAHMSNEYLNPAKRNVMVVKNEMRLLKQKRNVLQI